MDSRNPAPQSVTEASWPEDLRIVVETARIGLVLVGPDRRYQYANKAYAEILELPPEPLVGRRVEEVLPSLYADQIAPRLDRAFAGERVAYDLRRARAAGECYYAVRYEPRLAGDRVEAVVVVIVEITERERSELAAQRLAAIVEFSNDAIIGKDLNGIVTSWNGAAERMFGFGAAEMIGSSILKIIPSERRFEETEILAKIGRGEVVEHFETQRLRKDGGSIDVAVTVSPIKDASGRVAGASKIVRDITARKQAEEILHRASARRSARLRRRAGVELAIIIALSLTVFWVGRVYDVFDPLFDAFAYKNHQLNSDLDEVVATILFLCLALMVFAYRRWRESRAEVVSQTGISQALGLMNAEMEAQVRQRTAELDRSNQELRQEISENRRAQEQIAEQAALLDKASDAILVRDPEGAILFWSEGAQRMYGWTRAEAVGRKAGELLYADPAIFAERNAQALARGEWQGELRHRTKERRELVVHARWTVIRDGAGRPKSILAINSDITEQQKLEAQFLRAQRMESIGTLAGGVAHDLNNILAPIMMSIDLLRQTTTGPHAEKIIGSIEVSAKRGAAIVRQVLSFARGLEGQRIEVQAKHLVRDLLSIVESTFPKDIRLQFQVPTEVWTILGDPTQIQQVLLNLAVNARDAMPQGGSLAIAVENSVLDERYAAANFRVKPGRYVKISVTDTGTGIPPEIIDKIYEPFFTTKDVNKGTGLGLSTVMAIVKSHEGVINVYSELGKGTTFKVYLPAADGTGESGKEAAAEASLPRGDGETVLVVDDDASILTITGQTLEAFGYRALTASDGADALRVYLQHPGTVSVVLTDMMMPVMDGPALIHALRRIDPAVRVIAASGLKTNAGMASASDVAVKHFLTKPYTAETLLKAIRAVLDERLG